MGEPPASTPPTPETPIPPSIPDHTLLRPIGRGAYGEVWLARNVTGEWRAVKIVRRDQFRDTRPFDREFDGIRRAEPVSRGHSGMVDILHIGRNIVSGYFYYVMELADDEERGREIVPELYKPKTLRSELRRRTCLPTAECVQLGLGLAEGLAHLHQNGLVHRDIKPANIIFAHGQPKLADIGLVTSTDDAVSFVGTEGYVPPEGPGRPAADIYSLGKVLYEIATGRDRTEFPELPTFAGNPGEESFFELNTILLRACAPDSRKRYASAEKMLADLRTLADGRSIKNSSNRIWTRRLATSTVILLLLLLANWLYPQIRRQFLVADAKEPRPAVEAHGNASKQAGEPVETSTPKEGVPAAGGWDFDHSYRHVFDPEAERHLVERFNIRKYTEWQEPPITYWGPSVNGIEGRLTYHFKFPGNTHQIHLLAKSPTWDFRVQAGGRGWGTEAIYASTDAVNWQPLERTPRDTSPHTYDLDLPSALAGTNQLFLQVRLLVEETPNLRYTVAQHSSATSTNLAPVFQLRAKYAAR